MTTQSTAVMERVKGINLVRHSGEEILHQFLLINEVIARKAFELFEGHGGSPGHEIEDWSRAESEVLHPVPLNLTESNDEYTIRAEVPGYGSTDIEIRVEPRCFAISGKRDAKEEDENRKVIRSEWRSDRIFRILDLPSDVDASRVGTTLKDGILTVYLTKAHIAARD